MQPNQSQNQATPAGQPAGAPQVTPPTPKKNPNSAQNTWLISELRDNMVIMSDGSFRTVITSKSINFDLMSPREREGVEYAYQSFINALTFPVQVLIRSQRVDIGPYLNRLENTRRGQDNMLLGVLMDNYIDFIDQLAQEANIMDKSFFVVVPYYPAGDLDSAVNASRNLFSNLFKPQKKPEIKISEDVYNKAKEELQNRTNIVLNGLFQIGVRSVQLNTKELGELYYNFFNPDTAVRQPLGDFENVTNTYIQKGEGQAPKPYLTESF
jgi:hypothetical protein